MGVYFCLTRFSRKQRAAKLESFYNRLKCYEPKERELAGYVTYLTGEWPDFAKTPPQPRLYTTVQDRTKLYILFSDQHL
jgi:hypothetical protein